MVTELVIAGASAVLAPQFLGGLISKIPGGALGAVAVGAAMVYFGRKLSGMAKGAVVGAGVGLAVMALASFVIKPSVTA